MFQVGDKIAHPMHGAGVIDGVEEKKVNGTYRTFSILKCNYLLKWINDKGYLRQSWAYVLSSTDDKVKGNFRTWHNLNNWAYNLKKLYESYRIAGKF